MAMTRTRLRRPPLILWAVLLLMAFVTLLPYAWTLATSFKQRADILSTPPTWIKNPSWFNYENMLFGRGFTTSTGPKGDRSCPTISAPVSETARSAASPASG